jgi:acetylornithine deacetylase
VVVSLVRGGSELFTYPAECQAQFVWRTLPGQTQADLNAQLRHIFLELKVRNRAFVADVEWQLWREPMLIDKNAPIARAVAEAARAELGHAPQVCAAPWWTDAALIQAAGIPTVIFGPAGGGMHAVDEWVDLEGLERFERILLNVTRSFCG